MCHSILLFTIFSQIAPLDIFADWQPSEDLITHCKTKNSCQRMRLSLYSKFDFRLNRLKSIRRLDSLLQSTSVSVS